MLSSFKQKSDPLLDPQAEYYSIQYKRQQGRLTNLSHQFQDSSLLSKDVEVAAKINNLTSWNNLDFVKTKNVIQLSEKEWIVNATVSIEKFKFLHQQKYVCSIQMDYNIRLLEVRC